MSRAVGLIRLLRPVNCLMMGLAVLIGEVVAYRTLYLFPSFLGFVTAFTLTAASMVLNDYWDRAVDSINTPDRPIASGLIPTKSALVYAFILMAIGLLSAFLTWVITFLLAIVSLSISLFYSYNGKKWGLIGNFFVSICIAIPLFYGGFLNGEINLDFGKLRILIFFDLMVFLANTGREVNKGIADIEGDKTRGIRTVAIRFGSKDAAILAMVFYLSAVVLSVFPWLLSLTSWIYLPLVVVADLGFAMSSFILLSNHSKESAVKVKKMVMIWMVVGLLAFVTGVP
ncbi:MAG: UbiA family prenyltransferase [Candidatus Bathyarchaeota archaeon]